MNSLFRNSKDICIPYQLAFHIRITKFLNLVQKIKITFLFEQLMSEYKHHCNNVVP